MPHDLFYAIKDGGDCAIYWSKTSFENQCPNAHPDHRFNKFADAFEWVTGGQYNPVDEPPDSRCLWRYSNADVPIVFTSGAALRTGPNVQSGFGVCWGRWNRFNISSALPDPMDHPRTNGQAALMAAVVATEQAENELDLDKVCICTDSQYVVECFHNRQDWHMRGWRTYDGRKVKNVDLLYRWNEILDGLIDVKMEFVGGNQNGEDAKSQGQMMANWLAERGAQMCKE